MINLSRGENMKVIKVTPRGYCKGVVHAIHKAKKARLENPNTKITILGMLVHNRFVTEALKYYQIDTVDDPKKTRLELLDEIQEGIVIFTAHGINHLVEEKAKSKGLICIDATCQYVQTIHEIVTQKLAEGYKIGYIGKQNHPEAEAICTLSDQVTLIQNKDDLIFNENDRLFFTNQTTLSSLDVKELYETIKEKYPHALIENEICDATKCRQEAVLNIQGADCLVVVGDPRSNNTQRLAELGKRNIPIVYCVESIEDCLQLDFSSIQVCAITSGASTPTILTNQIITYLETGKISPIEIEKII